MNFDPNVHRHHIEIAKINAYLDNLSKKKPSQRSHTYYNSNNNNSNNNKCFKKQGTFLKCPAENSSTSDFDEYSEDHFKRKKRRHKTVKDIDRQKEFDRELERQRKIYNEWKPQTVSQRYHAITPKPPPCYIEDLPRALSWDHYPLIPDVPTRSKKDAGLHESTEYEPYNNTFSHYNKLYEQNNGCNSTSDVSLNSQSPLPAPDWFLNESSKLDEPSRVPMRRQEFLSSESENISQQFENNVRLNDFSSYGDQVHMYGPLGNGLRESWKRPSYHDDQTDNDVGSDELSDTLATIPAPCEELNDYSSMANHIIDNHSGESAYEHQHQYSTYGNNEYGNRNVDRNVDGGNCDSHGNSSLNLNQYSDLSYNYDIREHNHNENQNLDHIDDELNYRSEMPIHISNNQLHKEVRYDNLLNKDVELCNYDSNEETRDGNKPFHNFHPHKIKETMRSNINKTRHKVSKKTKAIDPLPAFTFEGGYRAVEPEDIVFSPEGKECKREPFIFQNGPQMSDLCVIKRVRRHAKC